ncbi:NADP-dependent oxidoreductase [Actinoplanes sp. HUAS TT8]|uniref:NADP-dependent oxidoreductase n=1 Tax=Actinoplanes sp. HUAS TT8 TaxID=3447453 RepID=UPI003F51D13E
MTRAILLDGYGTPDVLRLGETEVLEPGAGQIRVAVRFAGVGPTDVAIRSGRLAARFPGKVLGFEAAGTVESVGADVTDVTVGDEVAVFLPDLGGYAELVVADHWVPKPPALSWADAAALPASGEAAVRVLDQLAVTAGETVLLLGAAGSVGTIATQLAVARGATVIAAVRPDDFALASSLGATPVDYRTVPGHRVDAVFDASGRSDLPRMIELAGGPERVITLSDPHGPGLGVKLSEVVPSQVKAALATVVGAGLTLQGRTVAPLADAARVHALLESGSARTKFVLEA